MSGDPRRQKFALAVMKGFNNIINEAVHLEGDVNAGTPQADLKRDDALLCIHWYAVAIENISETILIGIGYCGGRVSVLDICNQLIERNSLKLVFESAEKSDGLTLGKLRFNPLEIQIYSSPNQEDREKFTLAHELGHYFLNHSKSHEDGVAGKLFCFLSFATNEISCGGFLLDSSIARAEGSRLRCSLR
jgi:hypothetical protein